MHFYVKTDFFKFLNGNLKVFICEIKYFSKSTEYMTIAEFVNSPKNRGRLCICDFFTLKLKLCDYRQY